MTDTNPATETLTDNMIEQLRREAVAQGDEPTVHACWVALGEREPGEGGQQWPASREAAREAVAAMITDARAQDEAVDFVRVVAGEAATATETTEYLALYTGPSGPISWTLSAASLREAREMVAAQGRGHYDAGADALGLPADADAGEVAAAVERGGWELADSDVWGGWSLYARD